MADYGALLIDQQGNPYYILDTMPLCLISKQSFSRTAVNGVIDIHDDDSTFRYVFCRGSAVGVNFYYALNQTSGKYAIFSSGPGTYTVDVYIFGYQYQTPPKVGIAIWDAQGRCVITNETKVLRGVTTVGDSSNPNNSGYNVTGNLSGDWAIAPDILGYMTGVINQGGQVYPFVAPAYSSAYKSGANTIIKAEFRGDSGGGGAGNIQYTNHRNTIKAIDISRY